MEKKISADYHHELIADDRLTQLHFSISEQLHAELIPPHWHSHLEILHLIDGEMSASVNENSFCLTAGDILIINPNDIHFTQVHASCRYYLLQIPSVHLERLGKDWQLIRFQEYLPSSPRKDGLNFRLSAIFPELKRLDQSQEKGAHLLFLIEIYRLLHLLYTEDCSMLTVQNRTRTDRDLQRIGESMRYVNKNYRRQLTLAEIAGHLSLTTEYFCRLFRKYTGQTFFTYVNQVRLMHFYQDLIHTDESITFLLEKNGITNYKVFIRSFRETYGTTPLKLRNALRGEGS